MKVDLVAKTRDAVLAKWTKAAGRAADEAVASMKELVRQVEADESRYMGPHALKPVAIKNDPMRQIAEFQREHRITEELEVDASRRGYGPAVLELVLKKRELGLDEEADTLVRCAIPLANKLLLTPPMKRANARRELTVVGDAEAQVERDTVAARKLLALADEMRLEQVPTELIVASDCLAMLRSIFWKTFGRNARAMSPAEFQRTYLSQGAMKPIDTFEPYDKWPIRWIDNAGNVRLPGWSPVKMKDPTTGAVIR
jgi:hypothetical protein